ncbi:unnamed protein product [Sphagnum jensenii]|uniref:Uncharacterized protein n=1 Tax=Sphagnum jensenii TaxID=128206 RepID=A0ABP1ABB1_9BRYO
MSSNFLLLFFVLVASLASNQAPPAQQCILDMFATRLLSQIVLPNVVIRKFNLPPVTLHLQEVGWSNNFSNLSILVWNSKRHVGGAHINSQMQLTSILDETWLGHVGCTSSINSGEASHLIPLLTVAAMVGSKLQVPSGTPVHRFTAL